MSAETKEKIRVSNVVEQKPKERAIRAGKLSGDARRGGNVVLIKKSRVLLIALCRKNQVRIIRLHRFYWYKTCVHKYYF
jgi:hypothetical protein